MFIACFGYTSRANSRRQPWLNSILNLAADACLALVARRHVLTAVIFHVLGELPGEISMKYV